MIARTLCRALAAFRGPLTAIALSLPLATAAQVITTAAGGGAGNGGLATNAPLSPDLGLAYDSAGNLFISDTGQNRVRRVDAATGIITTVAGNGIFASDGDGGPAIQASVGQPQGIALDSAGNLFVSDGFGNVVRRVDATTGIITTFAGSGAIGFSGDGGPATSAALFQPTGLALDDGNNLYVADRLNHRVRKVAAGTGIITTIAAEDPARFEYYYSSGSAMDTSIGYITALAWEPGGFLLISDAGWDLLYRMNLATGAIAVVAGQTSARSSLADGWQGTFNGDGGATARSLNDPIGVARNAAGEWVIADTSNNRVRKVAAGVITTIAGNGTAGFSGDGGLAINAVVNSPRAIAVDAAGNIAFVDALNKRVRRIDAVTGNITTVAGSGAFGSCCDGGPATSASLRNPSGVAVDNAGNLYIADREGNRIRRVDAATQVITTVAGNGMPAFAGDNGPPASASLQLPAAVALDSLGNLFIADTGNHRIRKVDAGGSVITTVAGDGIAQFAGDNGPATIASLSEPLGLAFGGSDNLLYIADTGNDRVRVVNLSGNTISTYAGDGSGGAIGGDPENGIVPYAGDGKLPQNAGLYGPTAIAFGPGMRLYIVDQGYGRVHKIDDSGLLATITGNGANASTGDGGLATAASVNQPYGIHVDASGNVLLSERHAIRRIDASTGVITTVAGIGAEGFSGDGGLATAARLNQPRGLARDATGNLFIADAINDRIRKVAAVAGPGVLSIAPSSVDFGGESLQRTSRPRTITLTNTGGTPLTVNSISTSTHFHVSHNCPSLAAGANCPAIVTFKPGVQGPLTGTLTVTSSVGSGTLALAGIGERSLVTHFYNAILRRDPDAGGKAFWEAEAVRVQTLGADVNETWYAMSIAFFSSAEYAAFNRDNAGFATDLYTTFFDRAPDAGGLAYWMGQLDSGMSREVLLLSFMFSPEFTAFTQGVYGSNATRKEVDVVMDFYRGLLARLPDSTGFGFWVSQFRQAQCASASAVRAAAADISNQFANSAEYAQRNRSNAQYVGDLYNAFLRRGADLAGVQYWLSQLDSGAKSRTQLRADFFASPEFTTRLAAVAAESCLP